MDSTNTYKIPPELMDIIPGYISRRDQDILFLKESLTHADFSAISMLGHKLKGNGASFGFDRISELGADLMLACDTKSTANVQQLIFDLENEIKAIKTKVL